MEINMTLLITTTPSSAKLVNVIIITIITIPWLLLYCFHWVAMWLLGDCLMAMGGWLDVYAH